LLRPEIAVDGCGNGSAAQGSIVLNLRYCPPPANTISSGLNLLMPWATNERIADGILPGSVVALTGHLHRLRGQKTSG